MEIEEEVIIYVNQKKFGKKNLLLNKTLEELRIDLEKEIPNQIYFEKEGKCLEQEEKTYNIHSILNKYNSIYLQQDFFKLIIDEKIFQKNVNLFKNDSFKKVIQLYKNELPENFMIKCKTNLLIQIINSSVDDDLLINDVLIGNSIFVFSLEKIEEVSKNILKDDTLDLIIKKGDNISFGNIQYKGKTILYSLMLDELFINDLKEPDYEIRRRESLKEYEIYKKGPINEEKLEKIISQNNTNENAIFDYLMMLKNNKKDKFQEKLKKYAYLLDINKLCLLDDQFKGQKFQNYKDEKTNLIKFLENVINGNYNKYYNNVDLILSEIDYRENIQKDIISPFIGGFNKEIYNNIPISISDNNLFFHYLRVKFFQYLQNSFRNSSKTFLKYCKILLKKIKDITNEKAQNSQKKLLIEILCMICIYGFHDDEKTDIINYYSLIQNEENEYYYHPIIFFFRVKNILFDYFRMIANSNCMHTALIEYKKKINNIAKKPANLDINNSIDNLMRNTVFLPFFSKEVWGFSIPAFNLSFINIDIFDLQEYNNSYPDYVFLFYFIKYIISFLHESIGHNFKIYEPFNENLETPFDTPRIKEDKNEIMNKGGYLMEILLINSIENLNIEHVLFLLNENNWALDHTTFLEKFKEIKAPVLKNCIEHIKTGKIMLKLLNLFLITKKSINKAIDNKIQLSIQISMSLKNEVEILWSNEKNRKNILNQKKAGRICRTHFFYK